MTSLLDWTRTALEERTSHPLLVIATFIVRFLAIHPFQDGNGRLSRALTTLLLLRAGYAYVPFSSLERIVEEEKDDYYRALRRAQATLDTDESQLIDWLHFFLRCLVRQKEVLALKIERERLMAPLSPLSEKLLSIVRDHGRVTIRDAVALLSANRNTIKLHLKQLVRAGHLVQRGRGRGTWYEML
jgi:Fic family protein